jgi:hypothetical protein
MPSAPSRPCRGSATCPHPGENDANDSAVLAVLEPLVTTPRPSPPLMTCQPARFAPVRSQAAHNSYPTVAARSTRPRKNANGPTSMFVAGIAPHGGKRCECKCLAKNRSVSARGAAPTVVSRAPTTWTTSSRTGATTPCSGTGRTCVAWRTTVTHGRQDRGGDPTGIGGWVRDNLRDGGILVLVLVGSANRRAGRFPDLHNFSGSAQ